MGRNFISIRNLGEPFSDILESMFLLCASGQRTQRSARPKILILLDGKCRITLKAGLDETMEPGDIFISPSSCRHIYSSTDEREDIRIYTFGMYFQEGLLEKPRRLKENDLKVLCKKVFAKPCILRGGFDLEMRHLIGDFRRECDENRTGKNIRLRAICLSLLVSVARKLEHPVDTSIRNPRTAAFLTNQAKEFMAKAMTSPLTLGQIAWHVKLSEEHLARIFKRETNMTVMNYLRFLRVEAAKTFLLNTNETIETLARRLGFGSLNPFCRIFKKSTSQTPTEFRINHSGSAP